MYNAFVSFPGAPLTETLVHAALSSLNSSVTVTNALAPALPATRLLQWSTYDLLDHELTLREPDSVLASSYTIRKALIRKHYLHRVLTSYCAKQPASILASALPRTWDLDIAWADELDDLLADELWDLAQALDDVSDGPKWYILKPGMADRGIGIRLFESRDALRAIFDEFDEHSDAEEDSESANGQDVVTSQVRHFVIQEYLYRPLLVNHIRPPANAQTGVSDVSYKFHLRAYCVAAGALTVYLWPHILALFSSKPYGPASRDEHGIVDLEPHLTNTSLQADCGEENVRLLSELAGLPVLSGAGGMILCTTDIDDITNKTAEILAETFRAALSSPVHFQPLLNAFELFGADLLITHTSQGFQVHLLELNAEPAIELTGPRLRWVLEDMFKAIGRVCVGPFFDTEGCPLGAWKVGETKEGLRKCLELQVRGTGGW